MRVKNGSPLTLAMGIRTKVTKALQHSGQVGHIYIDGEGFSLCVTAKDERNQSPRRWTRSVGSHSVAPRKTDATRGSAS